MGLYFQSVDQNFSCVFFDFAARSFSTDGVTTRSAASSDIDVVVECESTHLTSFAVLVNVAGVNVRHCNAGMHGRAFD